MESIIVGGLTFCWVDNVLIITTPTGQHMLNGHATSEVLTFLDGHREEIFAVDQASDAPAWAQPQAPTQYVIGTIAQPKRRLPGVTTRRRSRHRPGRITSS